MAIGVDGIYGLHALDLYAAEARKSQIWGPLTGPPAATGPRIVAYVTQEQAYPGGNTSITLTPATFTPGAVVPVTTPQVVSGGSPPGVLGDGMGPYRREGQVFGEQPAFSPFLSSAPPVAPLIAAKPVAIAEPVRNDDDLLAFLILQAMDGPLN